MIELLTSLVWLKVLLNEVRIEIFYDLKLLDGVIEGEANDIMPG